MSDKLEWQIEEETIYSMECNFCWREFEGNDYDRFLMKMKHEFTYAKSDQLQAVGWACKKCMADKDFDYKPVK